MLKRKAEPVWKGPEKDGITQSMLGRFLVCRERFRLLVVEGLRPNPHFNHRIEYGNMWHLCEECFAEDCEAGYTAMTQGPFHRLKWYCQELCQQYPLQQEQINHWYLVCKTQFPVYLDYWAKRRERKSVQSLFREQVFDVPYTLLSGRTVRLRGKWDGVNLVGKGRGAGIYLLEHKTKGDINEQQLLTQLQFDLQTMFYLVALEGYKTVKGSVWDIPETPARRFGIDYNVVRRPLSGGKHSIRQRKPSKANPRGESSEEFYARLGNLLVEEPEHYFMRWRVEVTPADLERFRREFLDPILEEICDWWDHLSVDWSDPFGIVPGFAPGAGPYHWRHPYGVWNSLNEGGSSELDEYLATGSELGLERTDQLFEELV